MRALKRHALVSTRTSPERERPGLPSPQAVQLFEREIDRIVLSRPAVEAGERLGFLPGRHAREKVDPYLRPIYDALYDLMDPRIVPNARCNPPKSR